MQDDLDQLIAGYSAAEPLAGLEGRIVQRVRASEAARKRRRWWGLLLVPAAAALVFALLPARRVDVAIAPPPPIVEPVPEPVRATVVAPLPRRPRRAHAAPSNPKQQYFPSVSPLSKEERILVETARTQPELFLTSPPADEIRIKPIEIAPLDISGRQ